MSKHNVRVRVKTPAKLRKNVSTTKIDVRKRNLSRFTKCVKEKQDLRQRYIQLMTFAEKAVGRKEAICLLREAESIWQKLNSKV